MSAEKSKPFVRWVLRFVKWIVIPYLALQAVMVVVFRYRWQPIVDVVRAFNKHILNPAMMKLAGRQNWYAAVIRHKGRNSGKEYETPVWAEPTPDGFLIPLPYGEDVDWLRNVLAAGECEIESKGATYRAVQPEVVDSQEAVSFLPARTRRLFELYGVEEYVRVKQLSEPRETTAA